MPVRSEVTFEVDEQAELASGELEVGEELRLVDRGEGIDGLELDDERVFHEEIKAMAAVQAHVLVDQGQRLLLLGCSTRSPRCVSSCARHAA